jgi:hypothetical protein
MVFALVVVDKFGSPIKQFVDDGHIGLHCCCLESISILASFSMHIGSMFYEQPHNSQVIPTNCSSYS